MWEATSIIAISGAVVAAIVSAISTLLTVKNSYMMRKVDKVHQPLTVTIESASGEERRIVIDAANKNMSELQEIITELTKESGQIRK